MDGTCAVRTALDNTSVLSPPKLLLFCCRYKGYDCSKIGIAKLQGNYSLIKKCISIDIMVIEQNIFKS